MKRKKSLRVGLLGSLEVTVGGESVDVGGARVRAVLAMLALANRRAVPMGELRTGRSSLSSRRK